MSPGEPNVLNWGGGWGGHKEEKGFQMEKEEERNSLHLRY